MQFRLRRSAVFTSISALVLLLPAAAVSAQTETVKSAQPASIVVRVHLVQRDDTPVVGAEVSVKGDKAERSARSDSNGIAAVEGLTPGSIEIRVRRVGFKQSQFLARVAPGNNEFTITIDGSAASLGEVRVVGDRQVVGRLEDFDMRAKRGDASAIITQAQIDKRNPVKLSQMLRGMPGLRLADSVGSTIAISTRGKKLGGGGQGLVDCVMRMMVDGIVLPAYTSIDQFIPREVYGVEIFNGPSRIPLNMGGVRQDNWCGLIAIWTRSG